ncbi:MAG: ATP-binding protein [Burkholderiaceae bacterium]|nr:ATP-binding protein [Burkholderiaceae bacterium]MDP3136364.1 ATP-binding protein [Burkholderiaceae bacterium]
MADLFRRPELAKAMAQQLLAPGVLDEGLRSGLFLSGVRRTGKTTFLRQDLIPALEEAGAIVIYVDLWTDTQANPANLVQAAIAKALTDLQNPASSVLAKLKQIKKLDIGVAAFKFGFQIESIGVKGGPTIAEALTEVVDQAKTNVVLIIDEVQHALTNDDGNQMLLAIKAARDAINPRPTTPGRFLFVGTGSHRAQVAEMTARKNQAFAGATSVPYPLLEGDYVAFLMDRIAGDGAKELPSLDAANKAFQALGNRPEEMLKALRQLQTSVPPGRSPDEFLPVIAATLRGAAADVELHRIEELGDLAWAIFERIAAVEGDARGVFSADALSEYSKSIGREVTPDQVQRIASELVDANLVMRKGHGIYGVTDPFVQTLWRERKAIGLSKP